MWRIFSGIFLILHGLVHFLYISISQELIQEDDIGWTTESWLLSDVLSNNTLKTITTVLYGLVLLMFVISGFLVLVDLEYWQTMTILSAILSSLVILVFWNGKFEKLPDQGFIGIIINIVIVLVIYFLDFSD